MENSWNAPEKTVKLLLRSSNLAKNKTPKSYKGSSLKFKRKSLFLHFPSLQPYNNKFGLLKLAVKISLAELQFSQYPERTCPFETYPLLSSTLQDLTLKELEINQNPPNAFVTHIVALLIGNVR